MTGMLKVSTGELTKTATSFQNTGTDIRNIMNKMREILENSVSKDWKGDASSSFLNKFNGLQDDIQKMLGMINEHVNDLQQMAKEYEKAEEANISAANALSADVIV